MHGSRRAFAIWKTLDTALAELPQDQREVRLQQSSDFRLGLERFRAGEVEEAARAFRRCVDGDYPDAAALHYLAKCRLKTASRRDP